MHTAAARRASARTADAAGRAAGAGPVPVPVAAGGAIDFATLSPTRMTVAVVAGARDAAAAVGLVRAVAAAGVRVPSAIAESGAPFWHRCCCCPCSCRRCCC